MSTERIAVAMAVISAAVSAASLLLTWYRGSITKRPRLAWTLGGLTLASTAGLIVALVFASTGQDEPPPPPPARLGAGEYRMRLIDVCRAHDQEARRIEDAEGNRPVFGVVVQLETRTVERLQALRPPDELHGAHRNVVSLWGRRLSLLEHYYVRHRSELSDPDFRREFERAIRQIDRLSQELQDQFAALGVTPECALFF